MQPPRKSQLFLNGVFPVTMTHDEVVRKKLKPGKFLFNPTGIIKVLGLICIFIGVTFYISLQSDVSEAKLYIFSVPNGILFFTSFVLYMIFSSGGARNKPWIYVKIDIILNVILPIISIVCSIIAQSPTTTNNITKKFPMGFGIAGNVLLVASAGTMFMFYRYKEDNLTPPEPTPIDNKRFKQDSRPSVNI